ncbi:hypothetical protein LAJ19_08895 [Deinococcus taeanensis]|uniref:hypothetical protein n=1 Tax=Deinococcus taeanensis TaxID=2737050 RepID=UPI001CDCD9C2|nr:hypothetical protein [Deinococcus taeanensis]UBV41768.1 hypothetical protein LAJ19_08895 [Deinococcus taeanensis]
MTRKVRDGDSMTWSRWGTPYLDESRPAVPTSAAPVRDAPRPLSSEALRRAIQAEEQRQVFAVLGRLRRNRPG